MAPGDRTRVIILTANYKITGEIALAPGARLTDYIVDAKQFVAVINAEVTNHSGLDVMRAPFMNIHRDHIEVIVPG